MQGVSGGAKGNHPPINQKKVVHYQGRGVFIEPMLNSYHGFFKAIQTCLDRVEVTGYESNLAAGLKHLRGAFKDAHDKGKRVIFIGNGGSSAIASHLAIDNTKNGGTRSIAFNDSAALTCLSNDFSYEFVFAKQIEYYAMPGDVVVIISSSGKSPNILRAAEQAFAQGLDVVTFSGMSPDNVLRAKGGINFYVPVCDYGLIEITHMALLHSIVSVSLP